MIWIPNRLLAAMSLVGALAVSGCAYDDGYGYGGVNVGSGYYGSGGYGSDYYAGGYGGWYNDYYYPGSGYYVYDRGGRRHRWNNNQRAYWDARRHDRGDRPGRGQHWDGRGDHDGRSNNGWRGNDRRDNDRRDVWRGGNRSDSNAAPRPARPEWQGGDRRPRNPSANGSNRREGWNLPGLPQRGNENRERRRGHRN